MRRTAQVAFTIREVNVGVSVRFDFLVCRGVAEPSSMDSRLEVFGDEALHMCPVVAVGDIGGKGVPHLPPGRASPNISAIRVVGVRLHIRLRDPLRDANIRRLRRCVLSAC